MADFKQAGACACAAALSLCAASAPSRAGSFAFTPIISGVSTTASGLNGNDQVAGTVTQPGGTVTGFVWTAGSIAVFQAPKDAIDFEVGGIASNGDAIATVNPFARAKGLIYHQGTGAARIIQDPGAILRASAINAADVVVGTMVSHGKVSAFVTVNGQVTPLVLPGGEIPYPDAIDDAGNIAGTTAQDLAFIKSANTVTMFGVPGADGTAPLFLTRNGTVGGLYVFNDTQDLGFTRTASGVFATFNYPGSIYTDVVGVGPGGEVAGNYLDSHGTSHGYVFAGGAYYTIDYPGGTQTSIAGLNARGSIAGTYDFTASDGTVLSYAFIATCAAAQMPCTQ